jgi:mannose-1-phosphate guanylyltransferase
MMSCEICQQLNAQYQSAVRTLQIANEQFRRAKPNSTDAAVVRRAVRDCLVELIAAEAAKGSHQAWHIKVLTSRPPTENAPAEVNTR